MRTVENAQGSAAPDAGPRPRVLMVGPLPPPLGGVQLMIDMQMHSSLAREFDLRAVDTSKRQLRSTAYEKSQVTSPSAS